MRRKWQILSKISSGNILEQILKHRAISDAKTFINPKDPTHLVAVDVGIDNTAISGAIERIRLAISKRESIVVYADYDADGICAGAIMWETLWKLGARVMPYIPHRVDEGYGLSEKGIDAVKKQYDPKLIITVDHGISAATQVEYAKKLGIDVIVTDHHTKPEKLPDCIIVHTTVLSGSGVSWFVAKELSKQAPVELAAMGTIADLLPLVGANRSIVKFGLEAMKNTKRIGLNALIEESAIDKKTLSTYSVSHMIAPRLNAMGRIEHALDALRLLCTKDDTKAQILAQKLGATNKERQQLTTDTITHAKGLVPKELSKLIYIYHETYNPGIIGLVAGKLVEEYYRPSIVLSVGEVHAKASARSIAGFNIVEAIRSAGDLLVDVGGHPMAAGFTVEVKNLIKLKEQLEKVAEKTISEELLTRIITIEAEIPFSLVSESLWSDLQKLAPFGFGNYEPVFATRDLAVLDIRIIGATKKHLKLKVTQKGSRNPIDAIAFNMADLYGDIDKSESIDLAYAIDMNEWNGKRSLQLKVKDIIPQ